MVNTSSILKQNTPGLFPEHIKRFGCRAFSLLAIPQIHTGKRFNCDQIIDLIYRAMHYPGEMKGSSWTGILGPCLEAGQQERILLRWAFELLERPALRCIQVGRVKAGRCVWWNHRVPYQYIIGHWDTGHDDGHWTLRDRDGVEIYDPWDPYSSPYTLMKKTITDKQLLYYVWEGTQ